MQEKFPTAGLAVIDLDLDGWDEIAAGTGYLERFVTPRSLV
jgi:phosphohistidine phosphatase